MRLSVGQRCEPCVGHTESGDSIVIRRQDDVTMLAVIDALGHGPNAARVAEVAHAHLEELELSLGPREMLERVDAKLKGTRGAAAMVCRLEGDQLVGCGVGNVELRVEGRSVPVVLSPGILGAGVARYRVFEGTLQPGARMVMFSDGLSSRASLADVRTSSPEEACSLLISRYRREHDDVSVVVADVEDDARQ